MESQEIYRSVCWWPGDGERKEDLVALLYYLLASSYRNRAVVEAYCPKLVCPRRFTTDPRDEEIVKTFGESPVEVSSVVRQLDVLFKFSMGCLRIKAKCGSFACVV